MAVCVSIGLVLLVAAIVVAAIVLSNVAQVAMDASKISFNSMTISDPLGQDSVKLQATGVMKNTPFNAQLKATKVLCCQFFTMSHAHPRHRLHPSPDSI